MLWQRRKRTLKIITLHSKTRKSLQSKTVNNQRLRKGALTKMKNAKRVRREASIGMRRGYQQIMETMNGILVAKLEEIAYTLKVELNGIAERFTTFETPINEAAELIAGTFDNFDKRTNSIARELRDEFVTQNNTIIGKLGNLLAGLENYANQLIVTNRSQLQKSKTLEENLSNLSILINTLNESIKILEKILQPKKKKDKDRMIEITNESLTEFSRQYGLINRNLEELFINTRNILSQVSVNIRKQSELNQGLVKNTTYLCDNIFSMKASFDVLEKAMERVIKSEEQMAEQTKQFAQFSQKVDSVMTQILECFKNQQNQNDLLIKEFNILSSHLKKQVNISRNTNTNKSKKCLDQDKEKILYGNKNGRN